MHCTHFHLASKNNGSCRKLAIPLVLNFTTKFKARDQLYYQIKVTVVVYHFTDVEETGVN